MSPRSGSLARTPRADLFAVLLAVSVSLVGGCGGDAHDRLRDEAIAGMLRAAAVDSVIHLANGDTLHVAVETVDFYRGREWAAAWTGRGRLLRSGQALHEALGRADEDGLPPVRYRHDMAGQVWAAIGARGDRRLSDPDRAHHLALLDILLTEGFNRLARDLVAGMLDPAEAGLDFRISPDTPPGIAPLNRVLAGEAPADLVAELRPPLPQYERMRRALATFKKAEARGGWRPVVVDSLLEEGDRHPAVVGLRDRFLMGVNEEEARLAGIGSRDASLFDADLKRSVQSFQDRHAIVPDGVVGAETVKELNHTAEEGVAELRLNLDRWRWLPHALGDRYVLVNVAGFELEVVEQGRVIESMNVVVGRDATQTPIFSDSIRYVVVNPYWNVPDGIMARTIQPAMTLDPGYLQKNDMEIVDGRVRQRPGPLNALGRYKFIFPNDLDVYLHDTPDRHLFARTERAFSSGCVRIERPRDFARMLLSLQSDQDPDSLDAILATGTERWLKLDRPLPVYLLYFTTWVQEDGSVRFHHDIYGRSGAMDVQADEMRPPVLGPVAR